MGTAAMSNEETGVYVRLLCYQWSHGCIPDDDRLLNRITMNAPADVLAAVKTKFVDGAQFGYQALTGQHTLVNVRLQLEREKQSAYRQSKSEAGKASAKKRASVDPQALKRQQTHDSVGNKTSTKSNSSTSTSTSSSTTTLDISWEAALKWLADTKKNGSDFTEEETRKAWLAQCASGWRWGNGVTQDYRRSLELQIGKDRDYKAKPKTNGEHSKAGPTSWVEWETLRPGESDADFVRRVQQ